MPANADQMPIPSERSLDLAEIALDAAANSCQFGASLRSRRGIDPLAEEYLIASEQIENLRKHFYSETAR